MPPPKQSKYDTQITTIFLGVNKEGSFIGHMNSLKYARNYVRDLAKFPYFVKEKYMVIMMQPGGIVFYEE